MNYFKILKVPHDASIAEIREQYKKLVLRYHPDKNKDAEPEQIKLINTAYEVLKDTKLRMQHKISLSTQKSSIGNSVNQVRWIETIVQKLSKLNTQMSLIVLEYYYGTLGTDTKLNFLGIISFLRKNCRKYPSHILETLVAFLFKNKRITQTFSSTIELTLNVKLSQMYMMEERSISLTRLRQCNTCLSFGKIYTCPVCKKQSPCPILCTLCMTHIHKGVKCHACSGKGQCKEVKLFKISLWKDSVIKHEGDFLINAEYPGDIKVHIKSIPDITFTIENQDLHVYKNISPYELIYGVHLKLRLPDDTIINTYKKGILGNTRYTIPNYGLPITPHTRGNLIIHLELKVDKERLYKLFPPVQEHFDDNDEITMDSCSCSLME